MEKRRDDDLSSDLIPDARYSGESFQILPDLYLSEIVRDAMCPTDLGSISNPCRDRSHLLFFYFKLNRNVTASRPDTNGSPVPMAAVSVPKPFVVCIYGYIS